MVELFFYQAKGDLHKALPDGTTPFMIAKSLQIFQHFLQEPLLTFLCGQHSRCGAESILQTVPPFLFLDIAKLIPH